MPAESRPNGGDRFLDGHVAVKQRIGMDFPNRVSENVKLWLPINIHLPSNDRKVFVPMKSGIGRRKPDLGLENDDEYLFRIGGNYDVGRPQMLAIPMIDEYADQTDLHLTHCADPYAKDNGFRVGFYFSDGTLNGTEVKNLYDPTKVLNWGGWKGPDTKGKMHGQNPLHPEVRDFYKCYVEALLAEYGKDLDGLIWDETHYIGPGTLGNEAYPGYANRGMMTLVKEVSAIVASFSREVALFTSDNVGLWHYTDKIPYALVAHGTYQDCACRPESWSWGFFPNHRNVLWSCNWAPISNIRFNQYAVETFNIRVAISNGPFGDDLGMSEMDKGGSHQHAIINAT